MQSPTSLHTKNRQTEQAEHPNSPSISIYPIPFYPINPSKSINHFFVHELFFIQIIKFSPLWGRNRFHYHHPPVGLHGSFYLSLRLLIFPPNFPPTVHHWSYALYLQQLDAFKTENKRLKEENGALIRVISKLSK